jgi:hypothetical protein
MDAFAVGRLPECPDPPDRTRRAGAATSTMVGTTGADDRATWRLPTAHSARLTDAGIARICASGSSCRAAVCAKVCNKLPTRRRITRNHVCQSQQRFQASKAYCGRLSGGSLPIQPHLRR